MNAFNVFIFCAAVLAACGAVALAWLVGIAHSRMVDGVVPADHYSQQPPVRPLP